MPVFQNALQSLGLSRNNEMVAIVEVVAIPGQTTTQERSDSSHQGSSTASCEFAIHEAHVVPSSMPVSSKGVYEGLLVVDGKIVEEDAAQSTENEETERGERQMREFLANHKRLICATSIVLVSLICLFLVLIPSGSNEAAAPVRAPAPVLTSSGPTSAPTAAPTSENLLEIFDRLEDLDVPNLDQLRLPGSPQFQAAVWLADKDDYEYSFEEGETDFQERYALAVFYYSTKQVSEASYVETYLFEDLIPLDVQMQNQNSLAWTRACNFLDPSLHVCDWQCNWDSHTRGKPQLIHEKASRMGVQCRESFHDSHANETSKKIVTGLQIVHNNLVGNIPLAELGLLSQLRTVNLAWNTLTGDLDMSGFELLSNLETLQVSLNALTVKSPLSGLSVLSNLHTLRLSWEDDSPENNLIVGRLPVEIGRLTELRQLVVEGIGLSGSLPTELGLLTKLEALHLGYNKLSGMLPTQLGSLTSLQRLTLQGNPDLEGSAEDLCRNHQAQESNKQANASLAELSFTMDCLDTVECKCCSICCSAASGQCREQVP